MSSFSLRLFNVSAIARAGDIAPLTVRRRIASLGIQPAATLNPLDRNPQPLFDETAQVAIIVPFLKARSGATHMVKVDGELVVERHEAPPSPHNSEALTLAMIRRGSIADDGAKLIADAKKD